ncbi:hypothetical protein ABT124_40540 [Streptomyces sp. NPDC001982]|uniref:hypothetical protein n=1 Tax=Streptomyces sp. NPDC001982 TaxID=3154405 RepID=UPI003332EC6C
MTALLDPDDDGRVFPVSSSNFQIHVNKRDISSVTLGRVGLVIGLACAAYAVVIVVTLLSGASSAPWLPVPDQSGQSSKSSSSDEFGTALLGMVGVVLLAITGFAIPWLLTGRKYMKNQNERFEEALKAQKAYEREVLEKLRKTTELATLMELNQGQIATYHRIVTEQADKAFKSSRMAMNIGLLLLVCAAIAGALVPLEQIRWFIGSLAAFSTLLSGYLTKTYLAMYKESIGQLNRYFDQPVLNSYYLTAERLSSGMSAAPAEEVRQQIIKEVLSTSSRMGQKSIQSAGSPEGRKSGTPVAKKKKPKASKSARNDQGV